MIMCEKNCWCDQVFLLADLRPLSRSQSDRNRVEIKVYRGANNEEEEYAPWGFVVRQPLRAANPDPWVSPSDKIDVVSRIFPDPR